MTADQSDQPINLSDYGVDTKDDELTGNTLTTFRGHLVNMHAESIRIMRDNLTALPWWAWRRRTNIRNQLAGIAVALLRDQPYRIKINTARPKRDARELPCA
jgi:hypothetical protein